MSCSERAHREFRIIFDSVPALIWFKDTENRILRANRAAAEAIGTTPEALQGRSTFEVYPDEAAKYHRDDLEVIRTGRPKLGILEPLQMGDGRKRWVRTDKIPYRDENGRIIGVIVFAVDVTERVDAERALEIARAELELRVDQRTKELAEAVARLRSEVAQRRRAEGRALQHQATLAHVLRLHTVESMAAELAHEINQPLAAIANFANGVAARLRARRPHDVAAIARAADQIAREAERASEVIRRVRTYVRKGRPAREVRSLNRVVQDAVRLLENEARRRNVTVSCTLARRLPDVAMDPIQIEQVVLNLLQNGLEAIAAGRPRRRELAVETRATPDAVELRVRDSGRGLTPRQRARAFDPFFTTKKDNLGMGLAISRSIVQAHGGRLWHVDGEPQATFAFRLPARRARAAARRR